METCTSRFGVQVDVTNPGQFLACCGLLELAHCTWPGAEGWFSRDDALFNISASDGQPYTLTSIVDTLVQAGLDGELSPEERKELDGLESRRRKLGKEGRKLPNKDEERRSSLGKRRREGALTVGQPCGLRLAWWQEEGDDVPKTFAGRQEVLRMARAMLSKLPEALRDANPLEYRCLLEAGTEESEDASKVEPFYFDARRFSDKLRAGFSLDVQEKTVRASAAPLTELMALVGLQRFRPKQARDSKWSFEYSSWPGPLDAAVAAAAVCGSVAVPRARRYRFTLRFRDDQKRYKAFGFAIPFGGEM